ncbi:deaminated glutathione amidase [Shimwellia blattae]|uniref:Hydrolase n=1 Tax=Shimwellia blattae (strain ATCC 29907 / DSM 4481 / JCM 1650 / NBRC 105725 / CDC 9005-74) TaxID=630626 RepID=I2BBA5_SHIBC|nr:deaminated glutathione amidase [Shimwellia blattae]AFJ47809.1 hydrolase [Shimwellia blattae DSM 4481 = NBRC 105725]GAB79615.1 putative hydrolase YbeM [Shimwellia blattae DSM 4481 = NBRC 105725]VDY65310.1 (R)-stereoselective amidase [Shimwellia blattae]VEC24199.1 (R)-stereoselective amidase [Shimwellia blattae]
MRTAVGQFVVGPHWQQNLATCLALMDQARAGAADLLVLPEALLARSDDDPHLSVKQAQTPDGPFLQGIVAHSKGCHLTTILTLHMRTTPGRAANTLFAVRNGQVLLSYQKLHLYDAFNVRESTLVDAGEALPGLIDVAGIKTGVMTCYDLRFPELALNLALQGAELLVVPAAWLRGPLKEQHWATLLSARALDTTCYLAAAGECGSRNIGQSRIVDPMGVVLAAAAEQPQIIWADIDAARITNVRRQLPVLANRRFSAGILQSVVQKT